MAILSQSVIVLRNRTVAHGTVAAIASAKLLLLNALVKTPQEPERDIPRLVSHLTVEFSML